MKNKKALYITQASMVAAIYVVLTYIVNMTGLASGVIQIRLSEALCVLPAFMPAAVPGLFIGCLVSNLLCGAVIWDVFFGSLATLIGAVITYLLRKKSKWLLPVPAIVSNTAIIPFVLTYAYGVEDAIWFSAITVFLGEFISCGILGMLLYHSLNSPYIRDIFKN